MSRRYRGSLFRTQRAAIEKRRKRAPARLRTLLARSNSGRIETCSVLPPASNLDSHICDGTASLTECESCETLSTSC
jgi:hypothetical protein